VFDLGEEPGDVVDRNPRCHASPGNTDAVAHEEVTIAAGDVVEVDLAVERSADGPHSS
jgi:hypothetical protein